jgi:transposase-like protein
MGRLDDISLEELQELREQTDGEIPREQVLAAIGRKQGDEIETLAERHGVVEKTLRNWLDRFEEIEQPPCNAPRLDGPPELTAEEREQPEDALQRSPNQVTSTKRGRQSSCSTTSKRSSTLSTPQATRDIYRGRAVRRGSAASQPRS